MGFRTTPIYIYINIYPVKIGTEPKSENPKKHRISDRSFSFGCLYNALEDGLWKMV